MENITIRTCQHCSKTYDDPLAKNCPSCLGDLSKPPKAPGMFIDSDTITGKDMLRLDRWALKLMSKHEHLFSESVPPNTILVREELKVEDVDIPQIYEFVDLHYQIFRKPDRTWAIRIMHSGKSLIEAVYAKI